LKELHSRATVAMAMRRSIPPRWVLMASFLVSARAVTDAADAV
jgi:hypothetical protein